MLELDIILKPFFEHKYNSLSVSNKENFKELLNLPDPLLYQILINKAPVDEENICAIVDEIINYANDGKTMMDIR